jgi:Fe-S-cluster-containing hydrogenase component 2
MRCQSCVPCLARQVCRTRALFRIDPGEPFFIEQSRCNACGKCIPACPLNAILYQNNLGRHEQK